MEQQRKKEQKEKKNLEKEMQKQRRLQLIEANKIEERNIKQLEKQLNLNKRKSKGIPKSFIEDGLGCKLSFFYNFFMIKYSHFTKRYLFN